MTETKNIGDQAEDEAAKFLKKAGYKILCRNYRTRYGEIDIVAKDKREIVFVEVRYRSNPSYGFAHETIVKNKQNKIVTTAVQYCKQNKVTETQLRFDVVSFTGHSEKPELIRGAFSPASKTKFFV